MTVMELADRIQYLSEEKNVKDQYWYVIKQEWNISKLCFAVDILEKYKKTNSEINFENFFKNEIRTWGKAINIDDKLNHRCLSNAEYIGLIEGQSKYFPQKEIKSNYVEIKKRVDGDFLKTDNYYDLFEKQVEKLYLQHKRDEKELRSKFCIHPLFVLYKVLLLLGEYTGEYYITLDEFKVFICFIEKYDDIFKSVEYIIDSRILFEDAVKKISKTINNVRIYNVFSQLKSFEIVTRGKYQYIELKSTYIKEIENKIKLYENHVIKVCNKENMHKALYSTKNIFEFYRIGVNNG